MQRVRVADFPPELQKRHFDDGEFVEQRLAAAAYAMVSRMIDALGVELDPGVRDCPPRLP